MGVQRPALTLSLALLALLVACGSEAQAGGGEELCRDAEAFLGGRLGMVLQVDPDTFNDWRTGQRLAGCRVTAAGVTDIGVRDEAARFYERLREAGWSRTPDPRDAPGEASLRFRMGEADCLYNVYSGMVLFTEAEIEVTNAVIPGPRESRYGVFVMCMPAMEAAPRDGEG